MKRHIFERLLIPAMLAILGFTAIVAFIFWGGKEIKKQSNTCTTSQEYQQLSLQISEMVDGIIATADLCQELKSKR